MHSCTRAKKAVRKYFHTDILIPFVISQLGEWSTSYFRKSGHRRPDIWAENRDVPLKSGQVATLCKISHFDWRKFAIY